MDDLCRWFSLVDAEAGPWICWRPGSMMSMASALLGSAISPAADCDELPAREETSQPERR